VESGALTRLALRTTFAADLTTDDGKSFAQKCQFHDNKFLASRAPSYPLFMTKLCRHGVMGFFCCFVALHSLPISAGDLFVMGRLYSRFRINIGKKNNCYDSDVSVNIMRRSGERLARGWLTMYHSGNGKWLENRRSIVI
jgi:hypothetical protein